MADGPLVTDPPVCERCERRHWFLDPCGDVAPVVSMSAVSTAMLDPPPKPAEILKAVKYYRAHLKRERNRQRSKRGG